MHGGIGHRDRPGSRAAANGADAPAPGHRLSSLSPLAGTFATALAIVLGTVLIRLILVPVGYAQHRADQRRSALMTKISSLRERYVNSPKRLETELNELYRAEGGSLARGCLPLLVQMPVFAALYQPSTLAKPLPYTTVVFAAFLPLAASLYLVATTAWTVAQSAVLRTVLPM